MTLTRRPLSYLAYRRNSGLYPALGATQQQNHSNAPEASQSLVALPRTPSALCAECSEKFAPVLHPPQQCSTQGMRLLESVAAATNNLAVPNSLAQKTTLPLGSAQGLVASRSRVWVQLVAANKVQRFDDAVSGGIASFFVNTQQTLTLSHRLSRVRVTKTKSNLASRLKYKSRHYANSFVDQFQERLDRLTSKVDEVSGIQQIFNDLCKVWDPRATLQLRDCHSEKCIDHVEPDLLLLPRNTAPSKRSVVGYIELKKVGQKIDDSGALGQAADVHTRVMLAQPHRQCFVSLIYNRDQAILVRSERVAHKDQDNYPQASLENFGIEKNDAESSLNSFDDRFTLPAFSNNFKFSISPIFSGVFAWRALTCYLSASPWALGTSSSGPQDTWDESPEKPHPLLWNSSTGGCVSLHEHLKVLFKAGHRWRRFGAKEKHPPAPSQVSQGSAKISVIRAAPKKKLSVLPVNHHDHLSMLSHPLLFHRSFPVYSPSTAAPSSMRSLGNQQKEAKHSRRRLTEEPSQLQEPVRQEHLPRKNKNTRTAGDLFANRHFATWSVAAESEEDYFHNYPPEVSPVTESCGNNLPLSYQHQAILESFLFPGIVPMIITQRFPNVPTTPRVSRWTKPPKPWWTT